MHTQPRRQRGAILVLTILFLVILLAAAALVIDVGRLYVLRTQMQNAADAAVMSAAVELNGKAGARERAINAATQLLFHQAPFSTSDNKDLLKHLQNYYDPANPDGSAIIFYSWIGSEYDPATPPCSTLTADGKCITTEDEDAQYIRITLDPLLTTAEEGDYGIDFYFAPSMALFLAGDPVTEGTTTVSAVAGAGGPVFCKYPPVFMCAYDEGANYPGIGIGEEVKFKDKDASTPWGPGNVGFLQVDEEIEIPLDDGGTEKAKNVGALAAALGNEFIRKTCDESIVSTQTGVITQQMRQGFNTRFGLYEDYGNAKEAFPPAPNTVDYPMDDVFSEESPEYIEDAFKGNGWNNTECLNGGTVLPGCKNSSGTITYTRPETFSRDDYISHYHTGNPPPLSLNTSRYALYQWELESILNTPHLDPATPGPIDNRNASSQEDCSERSSGKPGSQYCLNHNGEAIDGSPSDDPRRRVMRIAVIKCDLYNIQGNTPDIDLNPQGEFPFHEFFLTQHAQAASSTEFFAEYIGPVSEEQDIQEIKHHIIQLYE